MYKEVINQKQAVVLMTTFIIGTNTILGIGGNSKQDIWIAVLFAMVAAGIIMAVYARIIKLYPEKDLFEILDVLFGKVIGRILTLMFVFFSFHIGACIVKNMSEFMRIISLDATPVCIIALVTGIVITYAIKSGIESMGRTMSIIFPIWVTGTLFLSLLSLSQYDVNRLKPVLYDGLGPVLTDSFSIFALPFAETVAFLGIAGCFQKKSSPYKIYFYSLLLGGIFLFIFVLRTIMMLGTENITIQMFPPYVIARIIKLGDFIERIEIISAVLIISCSFTKATVFMFSMTKGIAHFFSIKDYHRIAAPLVLLTSIYSMPLNISAIDMLDWAQNIFPIYALPFQVVLPVITWIAAEIKSRKDKNATGKQGGGAPGNAAPCPQNQDM